MTDPPSDRPTVPLSDGFPRGVRECPVCGALERRLLHRQRFIDGGPVGEGYDVVLCQACGAGFADGIPAQEVLDAYYAERSKYTYDQRGGAESPYDFARFGRIADQVVPFASSPRARILDVGCATGGLLAVLRERGFGNVVGADPSPVCAAAAKRLHQLDVRVAALGQLGTWDERFDLILLIGVLEHLRDVAPAIGTVKDLLKPGGLIYCAQPDVEAFADCANAPYQQFSVEHVNFFSVSSMERLFGRCGLAPRKTWRWLVEWRQGVMDSVVSGVFGMGSEVAGHRLQVSGAEAEKRECRTPNDEGRVAGAEGEGPRAKSQRSTPSRSPNVPPSDRVTVSPSDGRTVSPPALPASVFDRNTGPALERYLARCAQEEAGIVQAIERLVQSQEPIFVWGAGTLTRRLLATTRLGQANIAAFVDSNESLQGRSLAGRTILAPGAVAGRGETIVIASRAFAREIVETIRDRLGLTNRIETL